MIRKFVINRGLNCSNSKKRSNVLVLLLYIAVCFFNQGCFVNSTITSLSPSLQSPTDINSKPVFQLQSPATGQTISVFQKFSGTCAAGIPIEISYAVDSISGASGPSSITCADDSTFNVGVQFYGTTPNIRSVSFTQAGVIIQPTNLPISTTGVNQGGGFDNAVNVAVFDSSNGKTYVGGSFTNLQQYSVKYLARLNSDGSLDTDFISNNGGLDADVTSLALDKVNQKLYVGGAFKEFSNKGITTLQNYITRLNLDGTVDTSFNSAGLGFNAQVNALLLDPANSFLYVGGTFTSHTKSTSTVQNYISRLTLTGTVDTTFIPAGAGFNNTVNALARDSATGRVFIGGTFTTFTNGASTSLLRVAALQNNGTVTTFVPAGGGANNNVSSLAWDPLLQKLYIAGSFTVYTNGAGVSQNRLTRLNSDGTVDTTFLASGNGFNAAVTNVVIDPSSSTSRLYVSGSFTTYSKPSLTTQNSLIRLTSTGTVDTTFSPSNSGFDTGVKAIAINEVNGDVYAGGSFISYTNGSSATKGHFARVSASGVLDNNYLISNASGFSAATFFAQPDPATKKIYVGGYFTKHARSSTTVQNYLARLNSDGSLDTTFIYAGYGFNGPVTAIHIDSAANKVYVGGNFTSYTQNGSGPQPVNYLCRLNIDGTLDTSFVPIDGGFNGGVTVIVPDPATGKLYVGGSFTTYKNGPTTSQLRITRLNTNGTVDTTFIPAGKGFDNTVQTLVFDSGANELYVGGLFSTFTDSVGPTTQYKITRLTAAGAVSSTFLPASTGITSGAVNHIALDKELGKVYVGGNFSVFTNASLVAVPVNHLIRLSLQGELDTSFIPSGAGFNAYVNGIAVDTSSHQVYACGGFTSYTQTASVKQKYVTRLNSDGSVDTKFISAGNGFNAQSNKCTLDKDNNRFYVAGNANSYNGVVIGVGLAVLDLFGSLVP